MINHKLVMMNINGSKLPLKSIRSGVVLTNKGYVLTSLNNINQTNKFIVEAMINDSICQFEADVFLKNEFQNFVILKIKTNDTSLFKNPVYSYSYMKSVETEKTYTLWYLSLAELTNKLVAIPLFGDIISVIQHEHKNELYTEHSCIGGPIFDKKGNILGLLCDVNDQSKTKPVNMQLVMSLIFSCKDCYNIKRLPARDPAIIEKEILTNLVRIKTF